MARFIVADLTDPSSIPKELEAIVPDLAVPVQPLLEGASRQQLMFRYLFVDHAVPAFAHAEGDYERAESKLRAKATMLSGRQV